MSKKIILVEPLDYVFHLLKPWFASRSEDIMVVSRKSNTFSGDLGNILCDIRNNEEQVISEIRKLAVQPKAIFSTEESFMCSTNKVAANFNLSKNSDGAYLANRNKAKMKEIWQTAGIPTPKSRYFRSMQELDGYNLKYPVIVKPVLGFGSCGVKRIDSYQNIESQVKKIQFFNAALTRIESRAENGFIVEEYIDGQEFAVDMIWYNGEVVCTGILSREKQSGPYYPDLLYYIDPFLPESQRSNLITTVKRAVNSTGFLTGATHTELKVKEGIPYVLESAARPGASGYLFDIFKLAYNIDFAQIFLYTQVADSKQDFEKLIRGLNLIPHDPPQAIYLYIIQYKGNGQIKQVIGLKELECSDDIIKVICHKKEGDYLFEQNLNPDYVGFIVGNLRLNMVNNDQEIERLLENLTDSIDVVFK